jgi:hypothetical protein
MKPKNAFRRFKANITKLQIKQTAATTPAPQTEQNAVSARIS